MWSGDLKEVAGALWTRAAKARIVWKTLEVAYVSKEHADSKKSPN